MSNTPLSAPRPASTPSSPSGSIGPSCLLRARPLLLGAPQAAPTWEEILGQR